jgi:hypothetical protein
MSIPTQPTETTIVQKAFRLYGKSNPSTSDINNAISDALAMVKSDLMDEGREWEFLRRLAYTPTVENVNNIQSPTDYSKLIQATIMDGTRRGTAQAGASTTITLASSDNGTAADTEAKVIMTTGGTGSGQARRVSDYNSGTKVATIDEAWSTNPDSSTTYLVVDEEQDLPDAGIWNYDEIIQTHLKDQPTRIFHQADDAEGDFYFDYSPDKIYGIRIRYYSDLRKEDTDTGTNARYARILRLLEQVFVQGTFVWLLQDDTRSGLETQKYASMLTRAATQFLYPNMARQSGELAEDAY